VRARAPGVWPTADHGNTMCDDVIHIAADRATRHRRAGPVPAPERFAAGRERRPARLAGKDAAL